MSTGYLEKIDENKAEMIETLQELIRINSVQAEPLENAPFGAGVQEAFEYMLNKAKADGFDVENIDNYGGHIEFGGYLLDEDGEIEGTSDEIMGILCHLDVVPEGKDWEYEPFGGELVIVPPEEGDGENLTTGEARIYGRGTADDKGPTIAAYYAMKALKDSGVVPAKKVRLVLGLDEETGWEGMEYYLKRVKHPDFGFTPDGDFPAIHGEMGMLIFDLAKKLGKTPAGARGISLRSVTGGNAPNMVADYARAVIKSDTSYEKIKERANLFRKETGFQINTKGIGKNLEITAQGISAHGALPSLGLNAISVLMRFLGELGFNNEDVQEFIEFYNQHIGFDLCGSGMGCCLSDEPSGRLIFNVGMAHIDTESAVVTVNIRYPVTLDDEKVYSAMLPAVNRYNLGIVKRSHKAPIFIPKDDPMILTLMEAYKNHTGDFDSRPVVIGGGTYARAVKNHVAFGAGFPGEPEVEHQKNEYIKVDNLVKCARIYADAIYMLAEGQTQTNNERNEKNVY